MLSYLADYANHFGPLRLLASHTFRTVMATVTSIFIGFMIGPWLIAKLRRLKFGQHYDDDRTGDLAQRFDKKNTPTMGGLLIFVSVFVSSVLWATPNIWVVVALFVYAALTAVGFRDDYLKVVRKSRNGISSGEKIIWQTLITIVALAALLLHHDSKDNIRELWVPFVKHPVTSLPIWALFVFIFLWLVGFSNAINLTDGLDGLAIGCTISVAFVYGLLAYAAGNVIISDYLLINHVPYTGELTIVCGAVVGAGLSFLWYNSYPAEVFMGDTGSLALGGAFGIIAVLIHQPFVLVIAGGVFVAEAVSVILQKGWFKFTRIRTGTGQRIFLMAPLHHHFQKKGWHESQVVMRFYILCVLCAVVALATLKLR